MTSGVTLPMHNHCKQLTHSTALRPNASGSTLLSQFWPKTARTRGERWEMLLVHST